MSINELPSDLAEKALKELNEDPETRLSKIEELRAKAQSRPGLRFDVTNKGLITFLRPRKFDVDRAFDLMVRHYEAKQTETEIYNNFTPSAEKKVFESGFNYMVPQRDQHGRRIFVLRPGKWDPNEVTLINNIRANLISLEIMLQEEETQINGVIIMVDFRGIGIQQAKALNPLTFRRYGYLLFNTYPIRIKGIHVLEQPAVFSVIFPIMTYFMKEKVKERVRLHGTRIEGLLDHINAECLPEEYSGTGGQVDIRTWVKHVINSEEELEHLWY